MCTATVSNCAIEIRAYRWNALEFPHEQCECAEVEYTMVEMISSDFETKLKFSRSIQSVQAATQVQLRWKELVAGVNLKNIIELMTSNWWGWLRRWSQCEWAKDHSRIRHWKCIEFTEFKCKCELRVRKSELHKWQNVCYMCVRKPVSVLMCSTVITQRAFSLSFVSLAFFVLWANRKSLWQRRNDCNAMESRIPNGLLTSLLRL